MHPKAQLLRYLVSQEKIVQVAGAHNGLSARLVEQAGFDAIWASGLEISAANAVPDANILTMTDYLEAASTINEAVSVPVIADCDTGYGNSSNVIRLVKKYEAVGIAAVCIEDKCFPKVNSYIPGRQELAPLAEFVGKIKAAKDAQVSPEFMVIARVEALIAGWGLEESWCRAEAYAEAGADTILIHSKAKTPDEIKAFIQGWALGVPLVVVPTAYPQVTTQQLLDWGVKIVIYANAGLRAAVKAMTKVLQKLRQAGSLQAVEAEIAPMQTIFDLQEISRFQADEKKYLRRAYDNYAVIIPAAGQPCSQDPLDDLLIDRPVAMLELNGKPLLQHNVETLGRIGLNQITVVTGYQADSVKVEGIAKIYNPDFSQGHILHSIMQARDAFGQHALIIYADILFEPLIIQQLLNCPGDIVLVVDNSFAQGYNPNKNLDLVVAKDKPRGKKRRFLSQAGNQAVRIGQHTIAESEADYEFIGIAKLSLRGSQVFQEVYEDCRRSHQSRTFHEAPSVLQASFTDLLQEIVDRCLPVHLLEVNSGWMEIHTWEDYQRACKLLGQPGRALTSYTTMGLDQPSPQALPGSINCKGISH